MAIVCRLNIENMLSKYGGGGGAIIQGASQAKLIAEGWAETETGDQSLEIFAPTQPCSVLTPHIKHMSGIIIYIFNLEI